MSTVFHKTVAALPAFAALTADISAGRTPALISGLGHIHKALVLHGLCCAQKRPVAVITADEAEACRLAEDLAALGTPALTLPARDLTLRHMESASHEYEQQRLGTLSHLVQGQCRCVIASVDAAVQSALGGMEITIPLNVDGMKLGEASIRGINAVTKSAGRLLLTI